MKKTFLLFLALSSLLFISCNDEQNEPIEWGADFLRIDCKGGDRSITVSAHDKTNWQIFFRETADWCTISPMQGVGTQTISFHLEPNESPEERYFHIYVQDSYGGRQSYLNIYQEANPLNLDISPTFFYQNSVAANCTINVSSTLEWTTEIQYIPPSWEKYPWCTLSTTSGTDDGTIVVSLKENPTETKRGAIITVRSGDIVKTDTIIQSANTLPDEVGIEINGVTWATKNIGIFGTFASNNFDSYGKFYQFNNPISYLNADYPMQRREEIYDWDWDLVNDPSPEGWRIATMDEMDALLSSGYRWVDRTESDYGCPGAWLGPDAENATKANPGKAVFFPALEGYLYNNAPDPEYLDYGFYFVTGRLSSFSNQTLRIHKTHVGSPRNNGLARSSAALLRCVKK